MNQQLQNIRTSIVMFAREMQAMQSLVREVIRVNFVPLEDRWEIYRAACDARLLPTYDSQQSIPALDELDVSWYDDFYKDRYALVEWTEIIRDIENAQGTDSGNRFKYKAAIDQIKEEILQAGYSGFENDW